MYALVDCETMYASCEAIFRPDLRGKPIVVLSNNDGCIVAMNTAAKALGVPKFEPYFKVKQQLKKLGVFVFSSNYELYGDISARIMNTLSSFSHDSHVYSIDEAFLDLHGHLFDRRQWGHEVVHTIQQHIGMPVRVGIGATKTLAKVANVIAKKIPRANGVCCIDDAVQHERILKSFPINEVWGVGRSLTLRLELDGVKTAWDLTQVDLKSMRRNYSVVLERTARELKGVPCIPFHDEPEERKQIVVSRAFSKPITELKPLQSLTADYLSKAMAKLRRHNMLVECLIIKASSSRFADGYVSHHCVIKLPVPTNDTLYLAQLVSKAVKELFKPGNKYVRSMVCLSQLRPAQHMQGDLLNPEQSARSIRLMATMDAINAKQPNKLFLGSTGIKHNWAMAREMKSKNYTTSWQELPKARC